MHVMHHSLKYITKIVISFFNSVNNYWKINGSEDVCTFTLESNIRCHHMYHYFNIRPNDSSFIVDWKVPQLLFSILTKVYLF